MTTRTRRVLCTATTTTTLCFLASIVLAPSAGAGAATLSDGAAPVGPSTSGTPVLTTTGTWRVDRDDRAAGTSQLHEGDRLSAVVSVTNAAAVPVSEVTLVGVGLEATCDTTTLAPGATTTCRTVPHRIDHVDAAIGAVTLSVRAEGTTAQGLLVRSTPTAISERAAGSSAGAPGRTANIDRTTAAVGAAGALAGLGALAGALAGHLTAGRRPRLRTAR